VSFQLYVHINVWRHGVVVKAFDLRRSTGRGFDLQQFHFHVTTLGNDAVGLVKLASFGFINHLEKISSDEIDKAAKKLINACKEDFASGLGVVSLYSLQV